MTAPLRRPKRTGAIIDLGSLESFDTLLESGARNMHGWLIKDVDLTERTSELLSLDPRGALLLGCELTEDATTRLRNGGALIFPDIPELPFDPYRAELYTPAELYAGLGEAGDDDSAYDQTPDARIYAWSRQHEDDLAYPISRALHDHSIDAALSATLAGKRVVGVMGGHQVSRLDEVYADAARLGRTLASQGFHVATGGGPGAMEAANLGAYLAGYDEAALTEALGCLGTLANRGSSTTAWARAAFEVRRRLPGGRSSVGIPTWFYGHEPPNAFADLIAKYFQNSLREDTLLRHCDGGIVFLPGAAGTVQEIFQDACENYYAEPGTLAPMVLVGSRHWSQELPAWQLLRGLARDRPMQDVVHLVDSIDEVSARLNR